MLGWFWCWWFLNDSSWYSIVLEDVLWFLMMSDDFWWFCMISSSVGYRFEGVPWAFILGHACIMQSITVQSYIWIIWWMERIMRWEWHLTQVPPIVIYPFLVHQLTNDLAIAAIDGKFGDPFELWQQFFLIGTRPSKNNTLSLLCYIPTSTVLKLSCRFCACTSWFSMIFPWIDPTQKICFFLVQYYCICSRGLSVDIPFLAAQRCISPFQDIMPVRWTPKSWSNSHMIIIWAIKLWWSHIKSY